MRPDDQLPPADVEQGTPSRTSAAQPLLLWVRVKARLLWNVFESFSRRPADVEQGTPSRTSAAQPLLLWVRVKARLLWNVFESFSRRPADVGAGRLTPEEAQTISAIVAKRAELFPSIELATEIEALKAQLAAVVGRPPPPTPIRRPSRSPDNANDLPRYA